MTRTTAADSLCTFAIAFLMGCSCAYAQVSRFATKQIDQFHLQFTKEKAIVLVPTTVWEAKPCPVTIHLCQKDTTFTDGRRQRRFELKGICEDQLAKLRTGAYAYLELSFDPHDLPSSIIRCDSLGNCEKIAAYPYAVRFTARQLGVKLFATGETNKKHPVRLPRDRSDDGSLGTREFRQRYDHLRKYPQFYGYYAAFPNEPLHLQDLRELESIASVILYLDERGEPTHEFEKMQKALQFYLGLEQDGCQAPDGTSVAPEIDWVTASSILHDEILKRPRGKWLRRRHFVAFLVERGYSYGFEWKE